MERKWIYVIVILCILGIAGCGTPAQNADKECDIEKIYHNTNADIVAILQGDTVPKEVIYGMGGEDGYRQWSSEDTQMITNFIDALRDVKVEKKLTDRDEFILIQDYIEDVIFILQDDRQVQVSFDGGRYITLPEAQYALSNLDDLNQLEKDIKGNAASSQAGGQRGVSGSFEARELTYDIPVAIYDYTEKPTFLAAQEFGRALFTNSFSETNPVQSPVSAYLAMALAGEGAKGQTAREFDTVMGADRQGAADLLMTRLPVEKEGTKVFLANSAWVDDEMHCETDWLTVARNSYRAQVYQAELSAPETMGTINGWIEDNTRGLIKDFLKEPLSEETKLVLFNTLYFKGKWIVPFEERATADRTFTLEGGKERKIPMMSKYDEYMTYVSGKSCDGIVLPYRDSDLVFVALKPTAGQSVRQMYESLDMEQIGALVDAGQEISVDLWLPKFEVTFDKELNEDLAAMGLTSAFDNNLADFTGIGFTDNGLPLYISLVRQKAVFILDEEGTEAAAVTEVAMDECAAMENPVLPQEVHFDSPFLYMVLDKETDMPLFIGIMDDPSLAQSAE
ncbi:MAG: serpin family protein [Lachnospiraceae bacterium]|nr:serpin family protein [Lachnospiraceae bacterium]